MKSRDYYTDFARELTISYNIAWYEQKAVIVLLALLHLGVMNIHLGPSLPAFLSPSVAKITPLKDENASRIFIFYFNLPYSLMLAFMVK